MEKYNKWEEMIREKAKEINCTVVIDKRFKLLNLSDVKKIVDNLEEEVYSFLSTNKKYVVDIETWYDDINEKYITIHTNDEWEEITGERY